MTKQKAASKAPEPLVTDPAKLDVNALALKLLHYIRKRLFRLGWRDDDPIIAAGNGPQDIATDVVCTLFRGPSKWDPATEPDAWKHLMSIANTRISNLLDSGDVRLTARQLAHDPADATGTPESMLIDKEENSWRERAEDLILERIIDDPELMAMHDLAEKEDLQQPAEVAVRLGWTRERVYRANDRLRRHRDAVVMFLRGQLGERS